MGDLQKHVHMEFLDTGDVIKIEGPPTDADKVREILEEQTKELMTKVDFTEINVDAKYHKHIIGKGDMLISNYEAGLIIGKRGVTIKQLQESSGAKIKIIGNNNELDIRKIVQFSGDLNCVETAKQLVTETLKQNDERNMNEAGFVHSQPPPPPASTLIAPDEPAPPGEEPPVDFKAALENSVKPISNGK